MGSFITLLITLAAAVALLSAGVAVIARYVTKRDAASIAIGALALPALIFATLLYWLATMEVQDAPPGMVIIGNMAVIGVMTPVTWLISYLTVRGLARRAIGRR